MVVGQVMARVFRLPLLWCRTVRSAAICWLWGIEHEGVPLFAGPVFVRTLRRGEIRLSRGVRFYARKSLNPLCNSPTTIDARNGRVTIGDGTGLSSAVLSSRASIAIGSRCLIGANTQIFDHNFHALKAEDRKDAVRRTQIKSAPVEIGDDCFIGANCLILKGTRLGAGSIVAAGSVVFGLDVPPRSLVRGNPAQVIRG